MNINTQSVIKAGGIGAAIAAVIGLLGGATAFISSSAVVYIAGLMSCCGWALIPAASGALYGYFTPGKETVNNGLIGGAISGIAAGMMFGIFRGIVTAAYLATRPGADVAAALGAGATSILLACCGALIVGGILGAIGGGVWVSTQGNKGA